MGYLFWRCWEASRLTFAIHPDTELIIVLTQLCFPWTDWLRIRVLQTIVALPNNGRDNIEYFWPALHCKEYRDQLLNFRKLTR